MFTITTTNLQACFNVSSGTPRAWLSDCPRERVSRAIAYRLPDVIIGTRTCRPRGLSAAEASSLVEVDRVKRTFGEDTLFAGDDAINASCRLLEVLTKAEAERLALCQYQFTAALVEVLLDRDVFEYLDHLRTVLVLHPGVLAYVMAGDEAAQPNWPTFSAAFAVVNAPNNSFYNEAA
jgi:hypothetical protein